MNINQQDQLVAAGSRLAIEQRAVLYARSATAEEGSNSVGLQLERCEKYARAKGLKVVNAYTEVCSGIGPFGNGMRRLMDDAEAGQFDAVLVTRLDRISRRTDRALLVVGRLKKCGVRVIFTEFGEDDEDDAFVLALLAAMFEPHGRTGRGRGDRR